jgi:tetratricopeptide (TPR) repeat protein
MKIKNYEGAAGCFAEACKLWRANPVAHCDLATAYLHLGRSVLAARALILFLLIFDFRFADAEASASTALGLDPKLVEARYARAMARKGRGNVRGAIVGKHRFPLFFILFSSPKLCPRPANTSYMFWSENGEPYSRRHIGDIWKSPAPNLKRAGISHAAQPPLALLVLLALLAASHR